MIQLNNVKSEIFNLYYGNVIKIAERFGVWGCSGIEGRCKSIAAISL
jgi:hypothetical protein